LHLALEIFGGAPNGLRQDGVVGDQLPRVASGVTERLLACRVTKSQSPTQAFRDTSVTAAKRW